MYDIYRRDAVISMEELYLFLASDDSMPWALRMSYGSEWEYRLLEELLSNDPLPLPEIKSSNLDHFNDPSSLVLRNQDVSFALTLSRSTPLLMRTILMELKRR
ncbi:hypothetical protein Tco_0885432 [Tanacetum coccineum]